MNKSVTGTITDYDGTYLTVRVKYENRDFILDHNVRTVEVRLNDGIHISAEQRKKIYATFRDIAEYTGYDEDDVKVLMKSRYCDKKEISAFSLSDVEMITASDFIDFMLDWCVEHGVQLSEPATQRCEDIEKLMFSCLMHKKCCICGASSEMHHVDAIGMGADRATMHHRGHRVIALCRTHHSEYHNHSDGFFERYHVVGIPITEKIAKKYKVKY